MAKLIVEVPSKDRTVVAGVIGINPNNPEFGSIAVSQTVFSVNEKGFLNQKKRVAFIPGEVEKLKAYVAAFNLTPGADYSAQLRVDSKLITKEQTTPFFAGQAAKINPKTSEQLHTPDGEAIYSQTFIVSEDSGLSDQLIAHVSTKVATEVATPAVNVLSSVV